MPGRSIKILGVRVDHLSSEDLQDRLHTWLLGDRARIVTTPNSEMLVLAQRDPSFRDVLNASDLAIPDTIGMVYASAALHGQELPRHPGVDTLIKLAGLCAAQNLRLLLFGGNPGSADRAVMHLREIFSNIDAHAIDPGLIPLDRDGTFSVSLTTLQQLYEIRPVVLAVALGHRKQETFLQQYASWFPSVRIAIGVGGALEMIGGERERAPVWMRERGLEWIWRVAIEPARWKRILTASVVFPSLVAYHCLRRRHFLASTKRVLKTVAHNIVHHS